MLGVHEQCYSGSCHNIDARNPRLGIQVLLYNLARDKKGLRQPQLWYRNGIFVLEVMDSWLQGMRLSEEFDLQELASVWQTRQDLDDVLVDLCRVFIFEILQDIFVEGARHVESQLC